ncbi:MAG: SAM-dependent methyltransferase [Lachnospiraceae bacterium]|nr:SAM-dependent methyltransferase [Lachnospiraceae bacterium]
MRLSDRLRMVAGMVPSCEAVADVGCDHAYLSVWLLREGRTKYAYACDVRKGPLAKAEETIRFFHMQERAETVLCDGLAGLAPGAAQVIVMAGMGGELTNRILTEGSDRAVAAETLVLQPQSDWDLVRRRVYALGFVITDEQCLYEDGKYYLCMRADRGDVAKRNAADIACCCGDPADAAGADEQEYTDAEYRYGRILPRKKDMTYLAWLTEECAKKTAMVERLTETDTEAAAARLASATAELRELVDVMHRFGV